MNRAHSCNLKAELGAGKDSWKVQEQRSKKQSRFPPRLVSSFFYTHASSLSLCQTAFFASPPMGQANYPALPALIINPPTPQVLTLQLRRTFRLKHVVQFCFRVLGENMCGLYWLHIPYSLHPGPCIHGFCFSISASCPSCLFLAHLPFAGFFFYKMASPLPPWGFVHSMFTLTKKKIFHTMWL